MAEDSVEFEGYDGIDDGPSYSPSPNRKGVPSPGRRGGKKPLSSSSGMHSGRRSRPIGRSFIPNINPRELASSVSSMLVMAVVGVIAVAGVLYYTFTTYPDDAILQFYGALAASMIFVLLLAYVAVKLLGSGE
ncbi:MAG TPA: hypothetical protein VGJ92_04400 [Methanocella sp.]|jgi:hypothetical protein